MMSHIFDSELYDFGRTAIGIALHSSPPGQDKMASRASFSNKIK